MARVALTPAAESALFDIWATVALDNVRAADGLFQRIMKKARLAAENPLMGAPRPELGPNARILIEGRYLIIYEPAEDGVTIIAIVHGARAPESWLAS
ncbi:type II toxin-antitoxin system RelE/ParE family toxin [Methylocystis sp. MJC1]|uniref:type II toxin-antitoxin system RelE/ParE family toxin n=1 Tax=Methylocystis sp. MJC1 TaxID=2654282 RepID=UPI001FF03B1B|nr:type II toxin-antitoxin system RelE/ParE family toxin [Methylocystis sp. MJC1]UZX11407.1 type II toxin-antitoxin system RelE/ParE family toxin [Methylocystis sp. MJC1]